MKKYLVVLLCLVLLSGFTFFNDNEDESYTFNLDNLYDYQKEYETEEIELCASGKAKTYMDYRMTTVVSSKQYQFMKNECTVDETTGFLYDKEGFIAVALGSYYGEIGDRFYFTLDSGIVLPLVKAEEKADEDTDGIGCSHNLDNSVMEFVIDADIAAEYFWNHDNGLVLNGNYNNYSLFKGAIVKTEKVLDTKKKDIVSFENMQDDSNKEIDIFNYASGY